ncbi:hypothetical protein PanWU01x14_087050 [Parasponia andersonii]|uniref:Uncharacterized protein n=1 Tax=Parasponia andersonii TaxID=3476 RepID=A0A2P5D8I8_PARAD|nr:hypothetical protein PanWU01x14_087050 [Parasponia andersonii]
MMMIDNRLVLPTAIVVFPEGRNHRALPGMTRKPIEHLPLRILLPKRALLLLPATHITRPRDLGGALGSILAHRLVPPATDEYGQVVEGLPGPLPGEGGLADASLGLAPGEDDGLVHGSGGDLGGAEEDEGEALVDGAVGVGADVEEDEIGGGTWRAEIGGGRRGLVSGGAVGVGEGGALGAGEALGGRRDVVVGVVELEAGGAERGRVEAEDARGAQAAVDASDAHVVEHPPLLGPTVPALPRRRRRQSGIVVRTGTGVG